MLNYAMARQPSDGRVRWQQNDALALRFEDHTFDVVACQFGVMFFPDKVQGYKEAHRVLKPGGQFLFNVWDKISENEFADTVTQALAGLFPNDPPRFLARTPHGHHDVDHLRMELQAAGFTNVSIDVVEKRSKASTSRDPAIAYCQGTPLRNEIEARGVDRLQEATDKAAEALRQRFGAGPIEGRVRAFVITAM